MDLTENPLIEPLDLKQTCGIIMPISPIDGCSTEHWLEVQEIIKTTIKEAGMNSNLVSDADDIGVIQGRIVQNIYNYPIVVCDVSGKNPNVMFELGLRLAFDKPTLIIKDDKTDYSFDTSPIEHISYPRDLRFSKILQFKEKLKTKLLATLKKANDDASYSPFLKHFGEFVVPKLEQKEVGFNEFVVQSLNNINDEIVRIKSSGMKRSSRSDEAAEGPWYETMQEKEEYLKIYLERLKNEHGHKSRNQLKKTVFSYLDSWKQIGYTENDLETLFPKVSKTVNFSEQNGEEKADNSLTSDN